MCDGRLSDGKLWIEYVAYGWLKNTVLMNYAIGATAAKP